MERREAEMDMHKRRESEDWEGSPWLRILSGCIGQGFISPFSVAKSKVTVLMSLVKEVAKGDEQPCMITGQRVTGPV